MFLSNRLKRAFTLVELSIVLALVAIVGTVTVSLCVMVSNFAKANSSSLSFMQEATLIKSVVESNCTDSIPNEDTLNGLFDNPNYETVDSVSCSVKQNSGDYLVIVTLNLKGNYAVDGTSTYIFTVNPRIGESVGDL